MFYYFISLFLTANKIPFFIFVIFCTQQLVTAMDSRVGATLTRRCMIQPAMVVIASTVRQIVTDPTAKDAAKISTSVKTVIAYLATATKQVLKIKNDLPSISLWK